MPKFPALGKALAVGGVLLALTMALQSVSTLVSEREERLREAERGVADSLAAQQLLVGPALQRRCSETWSVLKGEGKERKAVVERREFVLASAPAALTVSAEAAIEPRYRGIFKVNAYAVTAKLHARWTDLAALRPTAEHAGSELHCDAAALFVAVGDARGIRSATIEAAGEKLAVLPGTGHAILARGFHALLPATADLPAAPLSAEVSLVLAGTGALSFAPIADDTRVELRSAWPHPSFAGRFLPSQRQVGDQGFVAMWQLSALATSAPRDLLAGAASCPVAGQTRPTAADGNAHRIESFGVRFIDPVSTYVLSDRATKYGLLFIALTFVGVALVEVLRRVRVHPLQYLLFGSAVAMFFLLLVSLGEHIAFHWAYLSASAACTLLLAFYGSFVLHGWRAGSVFGVAIAALYGALFLLLQLEQDALVLGSLLLFAVLASVMVATRRIDWYALIDNLRRGSAAAEPPGKPAGPGGQR
ncbi:MAG: cell envelope integrity protein CreD [Pseudomonadota bacterium]